MEVTNQTASRFDEPSLGAALAECGWQSDKSGSISIWTLHGPAGVADIRSLGCHSQWEQFQLQGPALPAATNGRVLHENLALFGPAKLVARRGRTPFCRLDFPRQAQAVAGHNWSHGGLDVVNACHVWACAVTSCAVGETAPGGLVDCSLESVLADIRRDGWNASIDEDQLHIHFQLPGVFRQARVEQLGPAGVKVAVDLCPLDGFSGPSRRAARRLAIEANSRLPLVRLAVVDEGAEMIRAEVHLGSVLIPGAWLLTALEVVESAIALLARELEALRDPELGNLVLAAMAA